jgi:hypothetical protein
MKRKIDAVGAAVTRIRQSREDGRRHYRARPQAPKRPEEGGMTLIRQAWRSSWSS